jgi:hypothetical protein
VCVWVCSGGVPGTVASLLMSSSCHGSNAAARRESRWQ